MREARDGCVCVCVRERARFQKVLVKWRQIAKCDVAARKRKVGGGEMQVGRSWGSAIVAEVCVCVV